MPIVYSYRCFCCGNQFEATRSDATYCGSTCRKRAARQRKGLLLYQEKTWFKPEYRQRRMRLGRID